MREINSTLYIESLILSATSGNVFFIVLTLWQMYTNTSFVKYIVVIIYMFLGLHIDIYTCIVVTQAHCEVYQYTAEEERLGLIDYLIR